MGGINSGGSQVHGSWLPGGEAVMAAETMAIAYQQSLNFQCLKCIVNLGSNPKS